MSDVTPSGDDFEGLTDADREQYAKESEQLPGEDASCHATRAKALEASYKAKAATARANPPAEAPTADANPPAEAPTADANPPAEAPTADEGSAPEPTE